MRELDSGASNVQVVATLNQLIRQHNEYQEALEAELGANAACDECSLDGCETCGTETCCKDSSEECIDCGEGPCLATKECIQDTSHYSIISALRALHEVADHGATDLDRLTAAATILDYQIALVNIDRV